MTPNGSNFQTTLAPRCNWQISGKTFLSIMAKAAFIFRWKTCDALGDREDIAQRRQRRNLWP